MIVTNSFKEICKAANKATQLQVKELNDSLKLASKLGGLEKKTAEESAHKRAKIATILVVQGSQGAGKTYSILMRWIFLAIRSDHHEHCTIVTSTMPALRTGAIKDFETICDENDIPRNGTKTPYVMRVGKWTFEFFSIDDELKARGGRRHRLFINEANRLPWKIARHMIARTHIEVIFDFNPHESFWAHEQYVNTEEGQFVKLTYKDNSELPASEVEAIERHAPWGSMPDENFWRVFGLGEIGMVEGMILDRYKKYKDLPADCDYAESIGCDFGGRDAMTAVKVYVDYKHRRLFWNEIYYAPSTPDADLMAEAILSSPLYNKDIVPSDHDLVCQRTLQKRGIKVLNAIKGKLKEDLRLIKSWNLFIHEDSKNLIYEADNYKYKEVKGMLIDYPDQTCSEHAIDGGRYGTTFLIRD